MSITGSFVPRLGSSCRVSVLFVLLIPLFQSPSPEQKVSSVASAQPNIGEFYTKIQCSRSCSVVRDLMHRQVRGRTPCTPDRGRSLDPRPRRRLQMKASLFGDQFHALTYLTCQSHCKVRGRFTRAVLDCIYCSTTGYGEPANGIRSLNLYCPDMKPGGSVERALI